MPSVTSSARDHAVPRSSSGRPWASPFSRAGRRSHRTPFQAVAIACLVVIGLQTAGCGMASRWVVDPQYYLVEPSLVSLAEGRNPCEAKEQPGRVIKELKASDTLVLVYTDCIKKMLRARMNLARIARLTSSSFAVLTAAAAATLGAVATAPLTAITALAATSAVIPEFMRIFGADERARAYDEGVHLIEEAEGQYMVALASQSIPGSAVTISPGLTTHGAQLYVQVVASLKIVENLLVARLPKVEDIQRAQGRVAQIGQVQVVLAQTVNPSEVTATGPSRKVVYTATAKNITGSEIDLATLNVHVTGAKWQEKGTATNAQCVPKAESLECTITGLAAGGVAKVEIEADAPAAAADVKLIKFTGQVWHGSSKLPLSGASTPVIVSVAKTP